MTDPNRKSKKHFLVRVYRDLPIARRLSLITFIFAFFLKVPLADRKARLELQKADADFGIIAQALIDARNHPEDVRAMIRAFKLRNIAGHIDKAIGIWTEGDDYIIRIKELGRLATAFDIMSQRLLEAEKGLKKTNKELLLANEEVKKACDSALAATRLIGDNLPSMVWRKKEKGVKA